MREQRGDIFLFVHSFPPALWIFPYLNWLQSSPTLNWFLLEWWNFCSCGKQYCCFAYKIFIISSISNRKNINSESSSAKTIVPSTNSSLTFLLTSRRISQKVKMVILLWETTWIAGEMWLFLTNISCVVINLIL